LTLRQHDRAWFGTRRGRFGCNVYMFPSVTGQVQKLLAQCQYFNALQAGRSRVRFPMASLEFFIDMILPAAPYPWDRFILEKKWVPGIFRGGKCGRCVGLTTLPPSCADCLEICEPHPPGTLRACPGLYRDCFTLYYCGVRVGLYWQGKKEMLGKEPTHFALHPSWIPLYCAGIERGPPRWRANGYPFMCVKRDLQSVLEGAVILLVEFAKWRKVSISFAMSVVRPSLRPRGTTHLQLDGFSLNVIFQHFSKICQESLSFIKIWQE